MKPDDSIDLVLCLTALPVSEKGSLSLETSEEVAYPPQKPKMMSMNRLKLRRKADTPTLGLN